MDYQKGELVIVLNVYAQPVGEALINYYEIAKRAYSVQYLYANSNESEQIMIPEWMLQKKKRKQFIFDQ